MDWPTQIAERRIREAMERGRFNDSPLRGTKLVFKMLSNEDRGGILAFQQLTRRRLR